MTYDIQKDPFVIANDALKRGDMTTFNAMMNAASRFASRRPVLQNPQTHADIERVAFRVGEACQIRTFNKGDAA